MHRPINPTEWSYAQAHEVSAGTRMLFISGQVPEDALGETPAHFADQCRLVYANLREQLRAGDMDFANLVKITVFLADRKYRDTHAEVRRSVLGTLSPAMTVIITGIYEPHWLLEIEAIASA